MVGMARDPSALRLDYVSPLPPVRSGIADYSRDLLPHLAARCDLRVLRLPGQEVAPEVEERWHPAPAAETGAGGRLPLYQMGNNRYHEGVYELAMERPGVLMLHDLVLHHLASETTLQAGVIDAYRERLARDHGWVGIQVAEARQWGELGQAALFELPCHRTLVRRQRGVLVHSRWARETLEEEDPDLAVREVPMAVPLPPPRDRAAGAALRARLGLAPGAPLLGSFGFQTPIKRTDVVIQAMARPELAAAHLIVAGDVSPVLDLERVAREAGVADRVHLIGFLDYGDFEASIVACDLAVNLRYPTAGETSASLLRVLATGQATLVSDYSSFAALPDEVAVKVPPGEGEVEALAAAAGRLLADRAAQAEMGQAARAYVAREHDPERAARRIVEACRELLDREPPGDAPPCDDVPVTTLTWVELPGAIELSGVTPPWPAGAARELAIAVTNRGPARWLRTGADGGVYLRLTWRDCAWGHTLERHGLPLWRDLPAGETRTLRVRLRRPPVARVLTVEPFVEGFGAMEPLGGPQLVVDVTTGERITDVWKGSRLFMELRLLGRPIPEKYLAEAARAAPLQEPPR
jgi:glycosyltransferase involved in cell wall biosynthesis